MGVFRHLPSLVEVDLLPFVDDFHFETKVFLDRKTFIFALALSFGAPLGMVYEILQDCFLPYDYVSDLTSF
jgi:hypothetical protein